MAGDGFSATARQTRAHALPAARARQGAPAPDLVREIARWPVTGARSVTCARQGMRPLRRAAHRPRSAAHSPRPSSPGPVPGFLLDFSRRGSGQRSTRGCARGSAVIPTGRFESRRSPRPPLDRIVHSVQPVIGVPSVTRQSVPVATAIEPTVRSSMNSNRENMAIEHSYRMSICLTPFRRHVSRTLRGAHGSARRRTGLRSASEIAPHPRSRTEHGHSSHCAQIKTTVERSTRSR